MRISDQRLSPHFHLSEFTRSEMAERMEIDNTPTPEEIEALRRNAAGMEQVRSLLGVPILISSALRREALERVLCAKDFAAWCKRHKKLEASAWPEYFARKQHPKGLATDWTAPAYGSPLKCCRAVASSQIAFDQLILEHTWAHISWPAWDARPRREVLTLIPGGYARGIVEPEDA